MILTTDGSYYMDAGCRIIQETYFSGVQKSVDLVYASYYNCVSAFALRADGEWEEPCNVTEWDQHIYDMRVSAEQQAARLAHFYRSHNSLFSVVKTRTFPGPSARVCQP